MLRGAHIVLGVTGAISAYKVLDLVRVLTKAGAEVRVCMTEQAQKFIGALSFSTLSNHKVYTSLNDDDGSISHIDLARWADVVVVAPATANALAQYAQGQASSLLLATLLAARTPVVVAPCMNTYMWEHPATQHNIALLSSRQVHIVWPESGLLACGDEGAGKLADIADIVLEIERALAEQNASQFLKGSRILISAGPTQEYIDPVRYMTNASTGKMGFALAEEAYKTGAEVCVVSGPVALALPKQINRLKVTSAHDMHETMLKHADEADIIICCAAVSDITPRTKSDQKLKKTKGNPLDGVSFVETADILADLSQSARSDQCVVGFAAESEQLVAYAQDKLRRKGADMLVANDISRPTSTFGADTNQIVLVYPHTDPVAHPVLPLSEVSGIILRAAQDILCKKRNICQFEQETQITSLSEISKE